MHPLIWYKTKPNEYPKTEFAFLPTPNRRGADWIGNNQPQRTMISDKAAAAIITLTLITLLIGSSSGKKSARPEAKHVVPQPLQWSVVNVNSSDCFSTGSPEEWLRELDEPDARAVKTVHEDGSVSITKYLDQYTTSRRVLYPTRLACLDSISTYTYVIRH